MGVWRLVSSDIQNLLLHLSKKLCNNLWRFSIWNAVKNFTDKNYRWFVFCSNTDLAQNLFSTAAVEMPKCKQYSTNNLNSLNILCLLLILKLWNLNKAPEYVG